MKTKEFNNELHKKNIKELHTELQNTQSQLQELLSSLALGKLKNYREIRELKKRIAQISTAINRHAIELVAKNTVDLKEKEDA